MRVAGNLGVLAKKSGRRRRDTQVKILSTRAVTGLEQSGVAGKIELPSRLMKVESPTLAHQPRDRVARTEDPQVVTRSVAHDVLRAAAIKRVGAWPHAIHGGVVVVEADLMQVRAKVQFLDDAALRMFNRNAQRPGRDPHRIFAPRDILRRGA